MTISTENSLHHNRLRGETGERQLDNCDVALAHGTGGLLSSTGTVLLTSNN